MEKQKEEQTRRKLLELRLGLEKQEADRQLEDQLAKEKQETDQLVQKVEQDAEKVIKEEISRKGFNLDYMIMTPH